MGEMNLRDGAGRTAGSIIDASGLGGSSNDSSPPGSPTETAQPRPSASVIGYCGQKPWLSRGTIRDNILLGLPFERARYDLAFRAVALDIDAASWPRGDREPRALRLTSA